MYAKIFQQLLQRFFKAWGREPMTPKEWNALRTEARRLVNQQASGIQGVQGIKGIPTLSRRTTNEEILKGPILDKGPKGPRIWDLRPRPSADILNFPSGIQTSSAMRGLMRSGDVQLGKAPKTLPQTLQRKKDRNILLSESEEGIARIKRDNQEAIRNFKKKFKPEEPEFASGGIARVGMMLGGFTKAQVLIQMLKNTLKESTDPYVKKTFPNFIKEIQANPSLANNENVWKQFTTGLPKNQRLVVHSDDSVDLWRQSDFGPHNIETTTKFMKKHGFNRDEAVRIQNMEPEDQILEMKRLETLKTRTKKEGGGPINQEALIQMYLEEGLSYDEAVAAAQATSGLDMDISQKASGGRVPLMYGGDPGFAFEYGGSWADWHDQHRDQMPVEQYIKTKLPKDRLPFRAPMVYGGSAGLRAAIAAIKKKLGRKTTDRLFPKAPEQFRVLASGKEKADVEVLKTRMLESLLDTIKTDKQMVERLAKNRKMNDPGLNFLMKKFEETGMISPNIKQYKNIDKDIMDLEMIIKNRVMQKRKPNQSGGLAYMLGEPTYNDRNAYGRGGTGMPPTITKPPIPAGPPMPEQGDPNQQQAPMHPDQAQSDPTKIPRGIASAAPANMDPQYIEQQRMQHALMGQQGQPRMGMDKGGDVYGPSLPKKEKKKKDKKKKEEEDEDEEKMRPPETFADPFWRWGLRLPAEEKPGTTVDPREGIGFDSFGDIDVDMSDPRFKLGRYDPEEDYFPWELEVGKDSGGIKWKKKFNQGGRIGFGLGGINKGRRAFMKWLAGILGTGVAAGTGLLKLGKTAKVVPKVTETIVQSNAAGMPAWFPSLVKRVIKEGKDETEKLATIERQTVHTAKTAEGTPIQVTRDLVSEDIIVDIGEQTKHGWPSGRHGQPTQLILKKGEWIEPTPGKKGVKTKDEFTVDEAEFTGGHPENVKFEESVQFKYGDHGSDFSEVEKYAIGKNKDKKIIGKQADKDAWAEGRAESAADEVDFASGGLAYLLGE